MTIAAVKYEHAILLLGATNAKTHSLPVVAAVLVIVAVVLAFRFGFICSASIGCG